MRSARAKTGLVSLVALASLLAAPATAAELNQKTIEAFDRYARLSEALMEEQLRRDGPYLWVDASPDSRRQNLYTQLRKGEILIERRETRDAGKPIQVPEGLVHHWVGAVFIPGATLAQTLAVLQDYDNHWRIYGPDVRRSKLIRREGNDFKIYVQVFKKSLRTVVLNAEFDVRYFPVDSTRVYSRSRSLRIAEVDNPGRPDKRENPVGQGHGYLWRLYSYWRFEQKDGGVYVQVEYIALSRAVPEGLGWLLIPLIRHISRDSLYRILNATRLGVTRSEESTPKTFGGEVPPSADKEPEKECGMWYSDWDLVRSGSSHGRSWSFAPHSPFVQPVSDLLFAYCGLTTPTVEPADCPDG